MKNIFYNPSFRFIILVVLIVSFIYLGKVFSIDDSKIDDFLKKIPLSYSCFAFIILYVAGTFFIWYLKDPLKIIGAIIFGAYVSTFLIYIAEIINVFIFFKLSAVLGKEFIEKSLKGKFKKFYEKLDNVNLGFVFMLRAVPLIPYRVLDISFGLSGFPFKKYLLISIFASLPRIFLIQFPLAAARGLSPDRIADYFLEHPLVLYLYFFYFVLGFIIIIILRRRLR